MNIKSRTVCKVFLGVVLVIFVCWLSGCSWPQPGETVAEGRRRHIRNLEINNQELMHDIDYALFFEQPSRLTGFRMP